MVEHVAASEQEDQDQADAGPEVPVLDYRQNIGVCDGDEGEEAQQDGDGRPDPGVVDRAADTRVVACRQLACQPAVHALGRLRA